MCVRQKTVPVKKGPRTYRQKVECGHCWACKKNKENDFIGRALSEAAYSVSVVVLTLTYGDDETRRELMRRGQRPSLARTREIYKSDFQEFIREWRRGGAKTRYAVAGEFGSRKGRTHFHVILFSQNYSICVPLYKRFWRKEWPWGHIYAEPAKGVRAYRYVAKYLHKNKSDKNSEEWFSTSRRPTLGLDVALQTAARAVQNKTKLVNFNYSPPGYTGQPKLRFNHTGVHQHVILENIHQLWPEGLEGPQTDAIANAMARWKKYRQRKCFEAMCVTAQNMALQKEVLGNMLRPTLGEIVRLHGWDVTRKWLEEDQETLMGLRRRQSERLQREFSGGSLSRQSNLSEAKGSTEKDQRSGERASLKPTRSWVRQRSRPV